MTTTETNGTGKGHDKKEQAKEVYARIEKDMALAAKIEARIPASIKELAELIAPATTFRTPDGRVAEIRSRKPKGSPEGTAPVYSLKFAGEPAEVFTL
jgi:hypothetical protein